MIIHSFSLLEQNVHAYIWYRVHRQTVVVVV